MNTERTEATVLDGLELKIASLESEVRTMHADVRSAYALIRELTEALAHGQPLPVVPALQAGRPLAHPQAPQDTPQAQDAPEALPDVIASLAPHLRALALAPDGAGTLVAFLTALAADHASLTGGKPVTHETVRANILERSPRFKSFRGVYDRAGKKPLQESSGRTWLASEDPAAPGHTRYAQIMSGSLS